VWLSLLLGLPQTLWRDRHLAHHADKPWRFRVGSQMLIEFAAVVLVWGWWASHGAQFFVGTWLVGWIAGLGLCQLQGHFEHARGTTSHYGKLYNFLFFNDGYHVEHHARPGTHWSELPRQVRADRRSRFPAVLRWLELAPLDNLERLVLRSGALQRMVLKTHTRAFRKLLREIPELHNATIVGGGLFPRTALVLRQLVPDARLTIVDQSAANIACAQALVDSGAQFVEASFRATDCKGSDLLVIPLAFDGDRRALYENPPAPVVAIHDWVWRKRGEGVVVSYFLLKRLNWVRAPQP
jgi:hypothetical protein